MRAHVERFARRWWAGELGAAGRGLFLLTAPLSWAWSAAAAVRGGIDSKRAIRIEGVRVISVGNLAVGGTGKTPLAGWIARALDAAGVPTSVLVGRVGADEALLHRRWNPRVAAVANRDRALGAARARAEGARAVVMDDGFQHRRLARDLDLVLLSADDDFPGAVLPRGPYREAPRALARADAVIVTRRSASPDRAREVAALVERHHPGVVRAAVHLTDGRWTRIDGTDGEPGEGDALAVCGVARPDSFLAAVRRRTEEKVELAAFSDHHAYGPDDVTQLRARARGRTIVVTEKDAVKLVRYWDVLGDAFALSDDLRWDWGEEETRALVQSCLGEGVRR